MWGGAFVRTPSGCDGRPYNLYCVGADLKPCSTNRLDMTLTLNYACMQFMHTVQWFSRETYPLPCLPHSGFTSSNK